MMGPGKYDAECTAARLSAQAAGAILIIINGKHGYGFSAHLTDQDTQRIPAILRTVADQIEGDFPPEKKSKKKC